MGTSESDGRAQVLRGTEELVGALRATQVVRRYVDARRRFETDPEMQALLEGLQHRAEVFRRAQKAGEVGVAQVRELRELQAHYQAHALVRELGEARDAVGMFLQETNQAIRETLGVDLGRSVGPAGGAC